MANNSYVRRTKFAMVANEALRDERLSIEARGLLALLCTYSTGWEFTSDHLRKVCGCGGEKFHRMMGELREYGYLILTPRRTAGGKMNGHVWEVIDQISEAQDDRTPENPNFGEAQVHIEEYQEVRKTKKEEYQSLSIPEPENLITLDDLWKIYPHPRNRGAKPEAAFKKLKKDEREKFRDAIPAMKAKLEADHARGFDRQAPMFATYLNQRRFMTELEGDDAPAAGRGDRRYLTGETLRIDGE